MRVAPSPAPPTNIKNISQKWEGQTNVSSCPVVQLTSHLSKTSLLMNTLTRCLYSLL